MTDDLPTASFGECSLDDPPPFRGWQPSPSQIARWCVQIRREQGLARDGEQMNAQEARCGAETNQDDESIILASDRVSEAYMRRGDV